MFLLPLVTPVEGNLQPKWPPLQNTVVCFGSARRVLQAKPKLSEMGRSAPRLVSFKLAGKVHADLMIL